MRLCRSRNPCLIVKNRKVTQARSPTCDIAGLFESLARHGKSVDRIRERDHLEGSDHCSKRQVSAGTINNSTYTSMNGRIGLCGIIPRIPVNAFRKE